MPSGVSKSDATAPSSATAEQRFAAAASSFSPLLGLPETNLLISRATKYSIAAWIAILMFLYGTTPPQELRYLSDSERRAAIIALFSISTATVLLVMPFIIQRRVRHMGPLLYATLAVQGIAIVTNFLLAYCPVVVRIDPVTSSPVYLIRWAEWIPLAGLMTFLSEGVGIRKVNEREEEDDTRAAVVNSVLQSVSCLSGGLLCACCPNVHLWSGCMGVAVVTYLPMFRRTRKKRNDFAAVTFHRSSVPDMSGSYLQHEKHDRLRFSYHLMLACTVVWTILVVMYGINAYVYRMLPEGHTLKEQSLAMIFDTFFDVLAKALYMRVIVDVHYAVFDSEARAMRQLTELRGVMAILWDTSSDVIVVSIKDANGNLVSLLSPAFLDVVEVPIPESVKGRHATALMIETSPGDSSDLQDDEKRGTIVKAQYIDTSEAPYRGWVNHTILEIIDKTSFEAMTAATFVEASWDRSKLASIPRNRDWHMKPHPFVTRKDNKCQTEIKVSQHGDGAIIAIIRDVTERYRWYEAERRAHAEVVRRQQDAQSQTRFVRHEVKNGLLAGIELCDSLRNEVDAVRQAYLQSLQQAAANQSVEAEAKPKPAMKHISSATLLEESTLSADEDEDNVLSHISQFGDRVLDLDLLLHEVLETVLHEAMARDVIHEAYQPREERLDVVAVLSSSVSTKSGKSDRFPIQCEGDVPFLQMDSQLLRYIHRNAVSNAIKYGKSGGSVDTVLSFRAADSTLVMNVINERDDNDSLISNMSKEEYNAIVFSQGKSLHTNRQNSTSAISSGDGAWIMQKCAKTMGGSCSILFEREKTVFSFTAPVKPLKMSSHLACAKDFVVPPDTIGIAIDDSKIQRKLMTRILSNTGVSSDNTFILGESPSEVKGLQALLFRLLKEQPESKILILVDENLDYGIGSVVEGEDIALSGSLIVQRILQGMSPEQESRILALVRSANDSTTDVACYIERTHGFFPKAPMQKDRVREIIAPLWAGKFMSS